MMQPLRILSALGDVTRIYTFALVLPVLAAFIYEPYDASFLGLFSVPVSLFAFLATALALAAFWIPAKLAGRGVADEDLQDKEAYLVVGIGWMLITLYSALPFLLTGLVRSPVDAFFEAMSGLTTTGATILDVHLDDVPRGIMLWRAQLQFIGGMGIIVLSVALLARLSQGGIQMLQAEMSGPSVTRIRPKIAHVARQLWTIYAFFAVLLLVILFLVFLIQLRFTPLDALYDAVLHTMTGISSGGFSNRTTSITHYGSWIVEAVLILFMLVAATNFTLHYYALHGDWRRLVKDTEWRFFIGSFLVSTLVITGLLWRYAGLGADAVGPALRGASFTVASILTSTGYATVDYDQWPDGARLLLLLMMLTGGTAGSTAGGMKHIRILLLFKVVARQLRLLLHPRAVIPIRLGGRVLKEETVTTTMAFFFAFLTIALAGGAFVIITDPALDLLDGISAAASSMGNTGPALGVVGPTKGYWDLLPSSKIVLSMLMWFGRLEVFTALLLFRPESWRR